MELNTLNGVKNACMSFPVQNAWKAGTSLAVHGVVYNPADGKLKVRKGERASFSLSGVTKELAGPGSVHGTLHRQRYLWQYLQ